MVKRFLHLLPPGAGIKEREKLEQGSPEFQIDELFDVPGVGTVVGGMYCFHIV
jgi:selenocysteine-specific translation elongation factor